MGAGGREKEERGGRRRERRERGEGGREWEERRGAGVGERLGWVGVGGSVIIIIIIIIIIMSFWSTQVGCHVSRLPHPANHPYILQFTCPCQPTHYLQSPDKSVPRSKQQAAQV